MSVVEMLVVVAIVGVLVALMLPAIFRARLASDRSRCQANLRNLSLAVFNYEQNMGRLPPAAVVGPFEPLGVPEDVTHGIWPTLLAFLDRPLMAEAYLWDRNFDHPDNQAIVRTGIDVLRCPGGEPNPTVVIEADENDAPIRWAAGGHYGPLNLTAIVVDLGWADPETELRGPMTINGTSRLADIKDGATTTVLIAELAPRAPAWASPGTFSGVRQVFPGGTPGGAAHPEGMHVAFCDGSVRFVPWKTNPRIFTALCTRSGGEIVTHSDY